MAPATELTCTWADHLRQCSRFHHSCIDMQGALGQVAQWLQEQKPGKHTINNTNNITHITKPRRSSQAHVERGFMNEMQLSTSVQAADALRRMFTCVALIGVKVHRRGAFWAGTGVSTRSEETQVAAHILTRVRH